MTRFYVVSAVLASLLFVVAPAVPAQGAGEEASPWELGGSVGVGVNEPAEAFDRCEPNSTRGVLSLRGAYSVEPWLKASLLGAGHWELDPEGCLTIPRRSIPGTYTRREYPDRISGISSYFETEARVTIDPMSSRSAIRPILLAGLGRVWGKELTYPTIGVGANVPVGELTIRVEALGRQLSVPYDSVTTRVSQDFEVTELSRVQLSEKYLPLLFRIGVGWRP